ncbi:UDP-sugar transporter sqv-7 [Schistosoma japonicum]|nr:UDP-sugar transporter sqv-7 [Schistosoma japonicum]
MGIASTGSLSLPLFTALRRISNLFIMVGEYFLLGTKRSNSIHLSVIVMVIGAGIAAIGDITFDPVGYTYIFINNISTTGKALLTKSRLRDYNFSSIELIYFNSLLMLPILSILVYIKCEPSEVRNLLLIFKTMIPISVISIISNKLYYHLFSETNAFNITTF